MKWLKEQTRAIDYLGENINITFDNYNKKKSTVGGVLTILIGIFVLFCFCYFGLDIVEKTNPKSNFSKVSLNKSTATLDDITPVFVFSTDNGPVLQGMEKYVDILGFYYHLATDPHTGTIGTAQYELKVEKCKPSFFVKNRKLFTDPQTGVATPNAFCVNNTYVKFLSSSINTSFTGIIEINEQAMNPSAGIFFQVVECQENLVLNKTCAPLEERKSFLKQFFLQLYFPDYFIDINNYNQPSTVYINSYVQTLSLGLEQYARLRYKNVGITTDSGFFIESKTEKNVVQFDYLLAQTNADTGVLSNFAFDMSMLQDRYYRSYEKVPDLFAKVGGIINTLLISGKLICRFYNRKMFIIELANKVVVDKLVRGEKSEVFKLNRLDKLKLERSINPIINSYPTQKLSCKNLQLSFTDYFKACFNKKSKYKKEVYENLEKFIDKQYDLVYIIKQFYKIDMLVSLFAQDNIMINAFSEKYIYENCNFKKQVEFTDINEETKEKINVLKMKINNVLLDD